MPDLSKMTSSEKNKNNEPIVKFSYDNTPDETDGAMKSFQKRFSKGAGVLLSSRIRCCLSRLLSG